MVKYVMTVKIGSILGDKGVLRVAGITMRDTETGRVSVGTWTGTKEEITEFFTALESSSEVKVKYE